MTETTGKTGIEIHAGMSKGQRSIGKLMHFLHLDDAAVQIAKNALLKIIVDGHERDEPLYEAHFVECEPGEHDLKVHMHARAALMANVTGPAFTANGIRVTVEPGMVTQVTYTPKDGAFIPGHTTILEVTGKRPA